MRLIVHSTAVLAALAPALGADVVEIVAERDNTLFEEPSGALSSGSGTALFAGSNSQGASRRAVLAFDLSAIPPGSTIQSAELVLEVDQTNAGDELFKLHALVAAFGEGESASQGGGGAASEPGDATWLHSVFPSCLWQSAGGDYEPVESAAATLGAPNVYVLVDPRMALDVQDWLDRARPNHGWLLRHADELSPTSAKRIRSRESTSVGSRPTLRVTFDPGLDCGSWKFCGPAVPNSTGCPATIDVRGSCVVADDDLTLVASNLPRGRFGVFLASQTTGLSAPLGSAGLLCLSGRLGSFDRASEVVRGPSGSLRLDLADIPLEPPVGVVPGDTWHFQCWYRDTGGANNFTDAVSVLFR